MARNANQKRTHRVKSKSLLAQAVLLEMEKMTRAQERDRELREKVAELAKTSLDLYHRFDHASEFQGATPQLAKKCEELAKAIRDVWGTEGNQMIQPPTVRLRKAG